VKLGERLSSRGMLISGLSTAVVAGAWWINRSGNSAAEQERAKSIPFEPPSEPIAAPDEASDETQGEDGELETAPAPAVKKEERPERDRYPFAPGVTQLVYDSFDELVVYGELAKEQDVVVQVFEPGCPACEALGPRTRMVAKLLAKHQLSSKIRVCVIDASANRPLPARIDTNAYPVLVLFPKGDKDHPRKIRMLERKEGGRAGLPSVLEILEFVQESSGTGFKVSDTLRQEAGSMEEQARWQVNICTRVRWLDGLQQFIELEQAKSGAMAQPPEFKEAFAELQHRLGQARLGCERAATEGRTRFLETLAGEAEESLTRVAETVRVDDLKFRPASAEDPSPVGKQLRYGMIQLSRVIADGLPYEEDPEAHRARHGAAELRVARAMATLVSRYER
jgi:thiol-disulfide isomerase/thioredoxin